MFKQPTVTNCPVTRASQGTVSMPPELVAELVGTLDRQQGEEWLVLLHGESAKGGLEVRVTGLSVPVEQKRHSTEVELPEIYSPKNEVGVLHSHHSMGAFFSSTDNKDLNPRFDLSIVISDRIVDGESAWLGFSYQAVGRVRLPCGALGVVPFALNIEGVDYWPCSIAELGSVTEPVKDFGDCCHLQTEAIDPLYEQVAAKCGAKGEYLQARSAIFGRGSAAISDQLPPPVEHKVIYGGWRPETKSEKKSDAVAVSDDIPYLLQCSNCGDWVDYWETCAIGDQTTCFDCCEFVYDFVYGGRAGEQTIWEGREAELMSKEYGGLYD